MLLSLKILHFRKGTLFMENKPNLLETLKHLEILEEIITKVATLEDEATYVFSRRCSLKKIGELFNSAWEDLNCFETDCSGIPSDIKMQPYDEIKRAFLNVQDATIDRKEFEKILKPSYEGIENYIKLVEEEIARTKEQLSIIYDEIVIESSGDLKFIFTEPRVKEIILTKLLKS